MPTFTPPVAEMVTPRFLPDSTPLEVRFWRHFRPLDSGVNTYILYSPSLEQYSVVTDIPVPISIEPFFSSTALAYPWITEVARTLPIPSGTEGLPYDNPAHWSGAYSYTENWDRSVDQYFLDPYVYTWMRGGCQPYAVSAAIATILTDAGFGAYLT